MSAREVLAATERALNGARSVHVKGSTSDRGDVVVIDLRLTRLGARGVMRGPTTGKAGPLQMIATQRALYLRGRQFWLATAGAATAKRLGDRWVAVPRNGAPTQSFLSLQAFSRHVFAESGTRPKITKGESTKIAGRPAITLIDPVDRFMLYVAATGPPFPLRIVDADGKHHIDLSGYNAHVTIAKPKKAITY
jgi:hypothetical protein